ncbi:MAG TPA: hypothetical protein PLF01_05270 [Alphaproteobacteria bacterium]|nr:hypothetical protein [Alphaproteobacteria bacterium]
MRLFLTIAVLFLAACNDGKEYVRIPPDPSGKYQVILFKNIGDHMKILRTKRTGTELESISTLLIDCQNDSFKELGEREEIKDVEKKYTAADMSPAAGNVIGFYKVKYACAR